MQIINLCKRYKGLFWYGFFGIATTVINIITYDICSLKIGLGTVVSTIIAWSIAVIFAFLTNRKFVFKSSSITHSEKFNEFIRFIVSRLSTGVVDVAGMYIFVDIFQMNGRLIKILMNIVVIILNYIASKKVVFK